MREMDKAEGGDTMLKNDSINTIKPNHVPDTMTAVVIREHGGPEVLKFESIATPVPGPGEVLLKVEATALNHLDIFAREGLKGPGVPEITLPHISGVDIVGTVEYYGQGLPGQKGGPATGERVIINPAI